MWNQNSKIFILHSCLNVFGWFKLPIKKKARYTIMLFFLNDKNQCVSRDVRNSISTKLTYMEVTSLEKARFRLVRHAQPNVEVCKSKFMWYSNFKLWQQNCASCSLWPFHDNRWLSGKSLIAIILWMKDVLILDMGMFTPPSFMV
jgi:hypothetical protein